MLYIHNPYLLSRTCTLVLAHAHSEPSWDPYFVASAVSQSSILTVALWKKEILYDKTKSNSILERHILRFLEECDWWIHSSGMWCCHWEHGFLHFKRTYCLTFKSWRSMSYMECLTLEEKGYTFLWTAGNCLPSDTVSLPRRPESSLLNSWQIKYQCVGHQKNDFLPHHHYVPTVRALCRTINNQHGQHKCWFSALFRQKLPTADLPT